LANLYEFIGAKPNAPQTEIQKCIERTRTRLRQTGGIHEKETADDLRKAEQVLLNPEIRREYDKRLGLNNIPPPAEEVRQVRLPHSGASHGKQIALLGLLFVVFAAILAFHYWDRIHPWPTGIYLRDFRTGSQTAVLVGYTSSRLFPDGNHRPAYQVKMLANGRLRWVTVKQLHAEFNAGPPAPPSEREEAPKSP
jgi:hypothetical protein